MPTVFLRERKPDLTEYMERPGCNPELFERTLSQMRHVNVFIPGWRRLYKHRIRPALAASPARLLDVGCGGGDLLRRLAFWADRDGLRVELTGLERDVRVIDWLSDQRFPANVSIRHAEMRELLAERRAFDVVISNHVLHHVAEPELRSFLDESAALAGRLVLHNDIRRDDLAYLSFAPTALLFRRAFTTVDGLISIRRSYRADELRELVPPAWRVEAAPLYRNLVLMEK